MTKLVRAAVLTNYLETAQHLGLNPHNLLAGVGLNKTMLQDPEQRIPVDAAVRLLEDSAAASGCQNFGLSMAESRQLSDFGAVSLLLTHQRTLREALQVVVQYRHLLNDSLAIYVEEAGRMVIIREEVVTESHLVCRQANELAIGVMFRLCAALLGTHWHPYSVNFTHQAPSNLQLHRRLFGCMLEFGSEFNGIVCPDADLDATNPHADPAMARYAQRYLDSLQSSNGESMLFEVRKAIYLLLPMGRATIEHRPDHGDERAHPAAPPEGRRQHLQRADQRRAPRPGDALPGEPGLLAGAHRRHARLLHAEFLHPLVHRPVRHAACRLAQYAQAGPPRERRNQRAGRRSNAIRFASSRSSNRVGSSAARYHIGLSG